MTCRPDHSPRFPDFWPGHTLSLVHGGYSSREIDKRAGELRHRLGDWVQEMDELAIARALRVEARARLAHDAAVDKAEKGDLRSGRLLEDATAADRLADQLSADLGQTPKGRV